MLLHHVADKNHRRAPRRERAGVGSRQKKVTSNKGGVGQGKKKSVKCIKRKEKWQNLIIFHWATLTCNF